MAQKEKIEKVFKEIIVENSQIWWKTKLNIKKAEISRGEKNKTKNYMWRDMTIKYLTTKDKHLESNQSGGANLNDSRFLIWNLGVQKDVVQHIQ